MQYKVKEGLTKEMFINTKWNQTGWTIEQKSLWKEVMQSLSPHWKFKGCNFFNKSYYYLDKIDQISYGDSNGVFTGESNKQKHFSDVFDTIEDEETSTDDVLIINEKHLAKVGLSEEGVYLAPHVHTQPFQDTASFTEGKKGILEENGLFDNTQKPIKSDGGSSSYYDIPISERLLDKLIKRRDEGNLYLKTEELIEATGSDFDSGNIFKCNVRILSLMNGCGKEGNSVQYDVNKIKYSADRLAERAK